MNTEAKVRKRRSISLTNDELKALKQYRRSFRTEVECAEAIGISREVLGRTILVGSASPDTVAKIQAKLNVNAE